MLVLADALVGFLIASPFLVSAADKTRHRAAAEAEIAALARRSGLSLPIRPALVGVLAVQWLGGLALLIPPVAPLGALLLIGFLLPVTLLAHPYWIRRETERANSRDHFFANVAILGGLVLVVMKAL